MKVYERDAKETHLARVGSQLLVDADASVATCVFCHAVGWGLPASLRLLFLFRTVSFFFFGAAEL